MPFLLHYKHIIKSPAVYCDNLLLSWYAKENGQDIFSNTERKLEAVTLEKNLVL